MRLQSDKPIRDDFPLARLSTTGVIVQKITCTRFGRMYGQTIDIRFLTTTKNKTHIITAYICCVRFDIKTN